MSRLIPILVSSAMMLQACGVSRVALQGVAKTASEEERIAAYNRLRPAAHSVAISVVSQGGISVSSSTSVILADGSKIVHPGDFLPVLSEETVAVKRIQEFESAAETSRLWGVTGLLTVGAGIALMLSSLDDSDRVSDRVSDGRQTLSYFFLGASLVSLFVGHHYRNKAFRESEGVFATYDESLRQSLNLCLRGNALVDCAETQVAAVIAPREALATSASPTASTQRTAPKTGSVEWRSRKDSATGFQIDSYSYTASPELTFKVVSQESADGVRSDNVQVSIIAKHTGSEMFSSESLLALVVNGTTTVINPEWKVNQLSDGTSLESVSANLSGEKFTALFSAAQSFEFRVEKSGFALPSDALTRLRAFSAMVNGQQVPDGVTGPVVDDEDDDPPVQEFGPDE